MNTHIAPILEEARRAPSVLNSQPWRFRVCGNTIEVYLEKKQELEEIDPTGRLQIASCGTLIAHLEKSVLKRGWTPKVTFFPRFEEPDLLAFVETAGPLKHRNMNAPAEKRKEPFDTGGAGNNLTETDSLLAVREKIAELANRKDTGLVVHDDSTDHSIHTYLRNQCGEKLKSEFFRKTLNLYLRTDASVHSVPFEDEALLSDRFFDPAVSGSNGGMASTSDQFLILTTGTDNRYEWTRVGQVLGDIIMELRSWDNMGLMSLPIISSDNCRSWLKEKLNLAGYPQFVLKMQPDKPRQHVRKRSLSELLKYGF
ncbi:MAG: hypothetical protein EA363_00650 [Balneolaceae bacterium]|nr:MAG: hypothetical protein EA363_00650 [Balneolaceae bacterium]